MAFFEYVRSSRKHSAAHTSALIAAVVGVVFIAFAPPGANAQDKELVFGGFGGSFQKGLQKTVIKPFEKKFGVHVTYVTGTSNQLLAKVKGQRNRPEIDVIWANDTTHFEGKQQGLYAKLDTSKVTNLPQLYSFAKDPQNIGLVMGIQAIGLEYNTKEGVQGKGLGRTQAETLLKYALRAVTADKGYDADARPITSSRAASKP